MLKGIGTIRLIDTSLPASNLMSRCTDRETEIFWNQASQAGPSEPQGQTGAADQNGTDGADGQDGIVAAGDPASPYVTHHCA